MATAPRDFGFSIDPNDYYRPQDLAGLLGVSLRTVASWLNPPPGFRRLRAWRRGAKGSNAITIIRGLWVIEFFDEDCDGIPAI